MTTSPQSLSKSACAETSPCALTVLFCDEKGGSRVLAGFTFPTVDPLPRTTSNEQQRQLIASPLSAAFFSLLFFIFSPLRWGGRGGVAREIQRTLRQVTGGIAFA
jgi:hypothetical protein